MVLAMGVTEILAVFAAAVVFVGVLAAYFSVTAAREREAARKQWQDDLRTWGA
jgi:hypothetical protein